MKTDRIRISCLVAFSIFYSFALSYQKLSTALDVFIDGLPYRRLQNSSLGIESNDLIGHHCNISNESDGKKEMKFTPNRRLQVDTIADAMEEALQLGGFSIPTYFLEYAACVLSHDVVDSGFGCGRSQWRSRKL